MTLHATFSRRPKCPVFINLVSSIIHYTGIIYIFKIYIFQEIYDTSRHIFKASQRPNCHVILYVQFYALECHNHHAVIHFYKLG